jgi:hypothetical protein
MEDLKRIGVPAKQAGALSFQMLSATWDSTSLSVRFHHDHRHLKAQWKERGFPLIKRFAIANVSLLDSGLNELEFLLSYQSRFTELDGMGEFALGDFHAETSVEGAREKIEVGDLVFEVRDVGVEDERGARSLRVVNGLRCGDDGLWLQPAGTCFMQPVDAL